MKTVILSLKILTLHLHYDQMRIIRINADPEKNFRVLDIAGGGDPFQDSRASYFHNSVGGYHPAKLALYNDLIERQLVKGNQIGL